VIAALGDDADGSLWDLHPATDLRLRSCDRVKDQPEANQSAADKIETA
jgi:hypothetical protein